MGPRLQRPGARRPELPPHRRARPPSAPDRSRRLVEVVTATEPVDHGWPGPGRTPKELRQWVLVTFGRTVGRNATRRMLPAAQLSRERIKKPLGKAKAPKRAEHIARLGELFALVCRDEVGLICLDESHSHRDLDGGHTWGPRGQRPWRVSTTPGPSRRLNRYRAYDSTHGPCPIREDGPCDGNATCRFLERVARWRAGLPGEVVVTWDNAPCHIAEVVAGHAEESGIELVLLPGSSPDLDPIERPWDWVREGVTRGHCHVSLAALRVARQRSIAGIDAAPEAVVDRLWPKSELDPEDEAKLLVST